MSPFSSISRTCGRFDFAVDARPSRVARFVEQVWLWLILLSLEPGMGGYRDRDRLEGRPGLFGKLVTAAASQGPPDCRSQAADCNRATFMSRPADRQDQRHVGRECSRTW